MVLRGWILASIFCLPSLALAGGALFIDEGSYVNQFVEIQNCKFNKAFLANTLHEAYSRIALVNPDLPAHITNHVYGRKLTVTCDVVSKEEAIWYDTANQIIHLRVTNDGTGATGGNFFHEFLHHAGLDHTIEEPKTDEEVVMDPVYSCHITAFPNVPGIADLDRSLLPVAAKNCSKITVDSFTLFK